MFVPWSMRFAAIAVVALCALLPAGAKAESLDFSRLVAVMDMKLAKKVPAELQDPFTDRLVSELVKSGRFEVIDRANRDAVLKEQSFQCSDAVADECRVEGGRLLGAGKLVTGKITRLGKAWFMSLQLVEVETGKVASTAERKWKGPVEDLPDEVAPLVATLLGKVSLAGRWCRNWGAGKPPDSKWEASTRELVEMLLEHGGPRGAQWANLVFAGIEQRLQLACHLGSTSPADSARRREARQELKRGYEELEAWLRTYPEDPASETASKRFATLPRLK